MQGDDKDFFKFRLGSQEVSNYFPVLGDQEYLRLLFFFQLKKMEEAFSDLRIQMKIQMSEMEEAFLSHQILVIFFSNFVHLDIILFCIHSPLWKPCQDIFLFYSFGSFRHNEIFPKAVANWQGQYSNGKLINFLVISSLLNGSLASFFT